MNVVNFTKILTKRTNSMSSFKNAALIVLIFVAVALTTALCRPWWTSLVDHANTSVLLQNQQERIVKGANADRVINAEIRSTLSHSHGATRIRVALIDKAGANEPLRYNVTHVAIAAGTQSSNFDTDIPLAQWNLYLSDFLENKCVMISIKDPDIGTQAKAKLFDTKTGAFIGCPLQTTKHEILGAVFLIWDDKAELPNTLNADVGLLSDTTTMIDAVLNAE